MDSVVALFVCCSNAHHDDENFSAQTPGIGLQLNDMPHISSPGSASENFCRARTLISPVPPPKLRRQTRTCPDSFYRMACRKVAGTVPRYTRRGSLDRSMQNPSMSPDVFSRRGLSIDVPETSPPTSPGEEMKRSANDGLQSPTIGDRQGSPERRSRKKTISGLRDLSTCLFYPCGCREMDPIVINCHGHQCDTYRKRRSSQFCCSLNIQKKSQFSASGRGKS